MLPLLAAAVLAVGGGGGVRAVLQQAITLQRDPATLQQAIELYRGVLAEEGATEAAFEAAMNICLVQIRLPAAQRPSLEELRDCARTAREADRGGGEPEPLKTLATVERWMYQALDESAAGGAGVPADDAGSKQRLLESMLEHHAEYVRLRTATRSPHHRFASSLPDRFYFNNIGSELALLERPAEAQALWRDAVRLGVWPTADQRPVTTAIDGVYAAPFHSVGSFPWIDTALRRRLPEVLAEAAAVESGAGLHDGARPDRLHRPTSSGGSWSEYYFFRQGVREEQNCQHCPAICELYTHKPLDFESLAVAVSLTPAAWPSGRRRW